MGKGEITPRQPRAQGKQHGVDMTKGVGAEKGGCASGSRQAPGLLSRTCTAGWVQGSGLPCGELARQARKFTHPASVCWLHPVPGI